MVCTPGRMVDHLTNSASVHMDDVEILVLDEVSLDEVRVHQISLWACRRKSRLSAKSKTK